MPTRSEKAAACESGYFPSIFFQQSNPIAICLLLQDTKLTVIQEQYDWKVEKCGQVPHMYFLLSLICINRKIWTDCEELSMSFLNKM